MLRHEDEDAGGDATPLPGDRHRSDKSAERKFVVSTFRNKRDNRPNLGWITWLGILKRIGRPEVRLEKDGPAFSPARFDPAKRAKNNVREISILTLDYDAGVAWPDDLQPWSERGIRFAAYTTHSHQRVTADHPEAADRFRVMIPLLEPIPVIEYAKLWQWAQGVSGGKIDRSARDPSRIFYEPRKAEASAPYDWYAQEGDLLDWRNLDLTRPLRRKSVDGRLNGEAAALPEQGDAFATLEREVARVESAQPGWRNDTLNKAAFALGRLVGAGHLDESEVINRLTSAARASGLDEPELLSTIRSGLAAGKRTPRMPAADTSRDTPATRSSLTFRVSSDGLFAIDDKGEFRVCSPLWIEARTRNEHGEQWGLLLAFSDSDGRVKRWTMPSSLLAGDGVAYRAQLLDLGLVITAGRRARALLDVYLHTSQSRSVLCVDRIGWHENAFVLPDETISVSAAEIVFQSAGGSNQLLSKSGSLSDWQAQLGRYCSGNRVLVFSVSLAFASVLLEPAGMEGGGFHIRGSSSVGKTTALHVAGSIWGGGGERGFLRTWRSTANGLESVAAYHNHALLILDEISEVDPNTLNDVVYMLCNGSGKLRQTRNTTLKQQIEWRLLFLSSGEVSLSDHLGLAGKRSRGGQEVRLVNIEADAGKRLGIFEELHDFADPDEFAQHLASTSRRFYGTPIRAFLRGIVDDPKAIVKAIAVAVQEFQKRHAPAGVSGEVLRVAARFALVGYAGELACRMGILPWHEGETEEAAAVLFKQWLENRHTHGASDEEQAMRQVREFLERHGHQRFQVILRSRPGSANGDRSPMVTTNRAGFITPTEDGGIDRYYILPEVFEKEVCKGYDPKTVAKTLQQRGWLANDAGRLQTQIRTPEGKLRAYCVLSSILE